MVSKQMEYVIKALLHIRNITIKRKVNEHRRKLEQMSSGLELPKDVNDNK